MIINPVIDSYGAKRWRNEKGQLHREDGPAYEGSTGHKAWWVNGKHHRLNDPAIILGNGSKYWYQHGKLHRTDGPAYIDIDGDARFEAWYVNGKLIDIKPTLERLGISPDWKSWTEEEKFLVRLAL